MSFGRRTSLTIALALAGLCGSSTGQVNAPAPSTQGYEVIAAKSIFLRDRTPEPPKEEKPEEVSVVPMEQRFVLRGVVFVQDAFKAHVERLDGGGMMRLAVGDKVADGEVAEIRMDGISYLKSGSSNPVWVGPGKNLAGSVSNFRELRR